MPFREKWIGLQQDLLAVLDDEAYPFGQEVSDEFASYLELYDATVPTGWAPASLDLLLERTAKARVVLVGDHHTHCGGANMVIWLLTRLARKDRRCSLFLEALPNSARREIAAFMAGDLAEERFLERIGYDRVFGFDWAIYRHIVRTAARTGCDLTGINTELAAPGLTARDAFAASVIAGSMARATGDVSSRRGPAIVLVGEKHLAPPHLPRALIEALAGRGLSGPVVTIHRNATALYFNRLRNGHDGAPALLRADGGGLRGSGDGVRADGDGVRADGEGLRAGGEGLRAGGDSFLALDMSPLAIRAMDMHWFSSDRRMEFLPDSGGEGAEAIALADPDEAGLFSAVLKRLESFLRLDVPDRDDFHIHTGGCLDFLERSRSEGLDPRRYAGFRLRAARDEALYIAETGTAWVRALTPALLGRMAGLHLAARLNGGRPASPLLDGLRGALGAALLDPFSAHEPLIPFHPALDPTLGPAGSPAEKAGVELGRWLFRSIAAGSTNYEEILPLFRDDSVAGPAAERLAG